MIKQFIKFGVVGISNTLIALMVYYVFLFLGCNYLVSNIFAWLVSVLNAYFWNNRYVFKNNEYWLKALLKTYLSYGFSFMLSMVLLWALVEKLDVSQILAPILVLLITTPMNFVMNKYWTFRR